MNIPKIIHHVCDYPNGIPGFLQEWAKTWKDHHPNWEQRFWNKQQMEHFVHMICADFKPYYYAFPHNVQRWDAIRYLILYHIGGMYVDLDYECFESFDEVLSRQDCYIVTEPAIHAKYNGLDVMLSNALMAAAPGSKFISRIISELKTQDQASFTDFEIYKTVLNTTGPLMLSRVYESLKTKEEVSLLPADLFMPLTPGEVALALQDKADEHIDNKLYGAYSVHYFLNSW